MMARGSALEPDARDKRPNSSSTVPPVAVALHGRETRVRRGGSLGMSSARVRPRKQVEQKGDGVRRCHLIVVSSAATPDLRFTVP